MSENSCFADRKTSFN